MSRLALLALFVLAGALPAPFPAGAAPVPKDPIPRAREWPMFGGTTARNMVNPHEKLTKFPTAAPQWGDNAEADTKWEAEWLHWKAQLGTHAHGGPVVAGGRVYVGTNNQRARNTRDTKKVADGEVEAIDRGVLMCFDERTGKFLWQAVHDKLPGGNVNDWPQIGIASSPAVIDDRLYYVSNQCRVVCLDVQGFANGNQGIKTEKYTDATDADIVWEYDMIRELKVFPHNLANCSPLVVGDRIFVCTTNGVDEGHINIPAPDAPSLICLDRNTGKLLWKDASPGKNIMHAQWSNPTFAPDPVPQVIHGQGDGWLRAFDPATGKLLWAFDGNRKGAKYELGGTGDKCDFLGTPVVHNGRVYIGTGQDPEHFTGIAHLWCIDLKKAVEFGAKAPNRDVSTEIELPPVKRADGTEMVPVRANQASAAVWVFGGEEKRKWAPRDFTFGRTMSTVAVVDDVVYAAEVHGYVHCLSAKTGELYWTCDTRASIWSSPYYVDGKVLVTTDAGELYVLKHLKEPKKFDGVLAAQGAPNQKAAKMIQKATRLAFEAEYLLAKVEFPAAIRTTPVVANGVLYVPTESALFALKTK
jgi:outer membrane protein assembly factor BamB